MNLVHFMAQGIEEATRHDHSVVGKVFKCFLYPCLADKLYLPFRIICNNPIISSVVVLVLYLVFLIVYFPLWIIGLLITPYGSLLLFLVLFHFLAIFIARAIAFPGSSSSTLRQMSGDTIRRLADYMEQTAVATKEIASCFMLIANGKVPRDQIEVNIFTLSQIWPAVEYFPHINVFFGDAIDQIQAENALTPEELATVQSLRSGLEECFTHFKELFQFALNTREDRVKNSNFSQTLLVLSARCLNSSEKVRTCAHAMKPMGSSGDDDMVSGIIKSLSFLTSGMSGYERLSFPYLRAILKKKHKAEIMQITGCDNNSIDGIIFRASLDPRQEGKYDNGSRPLVLFCSPNAGFYECISQFNFDKSWFGFYLNHGMDVFVYNYRGYGRSQGAPTPLALKSDGLKVVEFIRREYNPSKLIIHGESIGGMIACHIARHCNVEALICDRTFSSLDSAASRLMGNWAGMSMRNLVLWNTNVVDDFLQAHCEKLILQVCNTYTILFLFLLLLS